MAKTKISEKYLKAIEGDQRENLPSAFFYKHFVDQYARALSLDVREILEEVDRLLSSEAPLPLPGQNEKVPRRISPVQYVSRESHTRLYVSLAVLALSLVGCSGLYLWWHDLRLPTGRPAPSTVQAAAKSAPATGQPDSLAAAQPASPQLPSVPETRLTAGYKVLLDLIARESTWLSVSSDGRMVFTGVLERNQTKTVEGKEFAKLRVNNAAALEVRWNGKPIGPLGSQGQGLVVVFTPGNFQIVAPVKEGD